MEESKNVYSFMSSEINEISAALSAFQGEVEQPKLNKSNPFFKSRYVDLSGILSAVQKTMAKHSLCVTQLIEGEDVITLLTHSSGQWFKSVNPIGFFKTVQERGASITYAKRYAISAILGLAADADNDGNEVVDSQAVEEMKAVTTEAQFNDCWYKWKQLVPAITQVGTRFYNVALEKKQLLKQAK